MKKATFTEVAGLLAFSLLATRFLGYDKSMDLFEEKDKREQAHVDRLIAAIDKTYHDTKFLIWRNFLGGVMTGLGATIGVAIILALLGFLIRELGGLPVIGNWLNQLGQIIPTHR